MANQELREVRGVVEATAQNAPDRYGVRISGEWYDGFGSCPAKRGDEVEVAYVENGRFRNVQEVRLAEGSDAESAHVRSAADGDRDERIARAVALKCAARLYADGWATAKEITDLAEKLERWLRATS